MKLFHDKRPEKTEKFSSSGLVIPESTVKVQDRTKTKVAKTFVKSSTTSSKLEYRIPPSTEKRNVVRTVIMPNNVADSKDEEIEFLKQQLIKQREDFEMQLSAIEEDKQMREEEFRLFKIEKEKSVESLLEKNQKLERLNQSITKDILDLKYETNRNLRDMQEKLELAHTQIEQMRASYDNITDKVTKREEAREKEFDKKSKVLSNTMRKQVKHKEENISIIKEQYKQIQGIYASRVREMEGMIEDLTRKYASLEDRNRSALLSYESEIKIVRERLAGFERYIGRLKKLTFAMKENKNEIARELSRKEREMGNLNEFREGLDDLEERIRKEKQIKEEDFNSAAEQSEENEMEEDYENAEEEDEEFEENEENEQNEEEEN